MTMTPEGSHKCPHCGYEYLSWVSVCPDCGAPIEDEPLQQTTDAKFKPDEDPRWTIVANMPNAILGKFVKDQIEDAGIPVLMFRSRSADIAQFSHNDFVPQDLLVPLELVTAARSLIDAAPGDPYEASDQMAREEQVQWTEETVPTAQAGIDARNDLPQGWRMLPTESDLNQYQVARKSHGAALGGWHSSDETTPVG